MASASALSSSDYQRYLTTNTLPCSMSALGHCGDNAACEGFLDMLKRASDLLNCHVGGIEVDTTLDEAEQDGAALTLSSAVLPWKIPSASAGFQAQFMSTIVDRNTRSSPGVTLARDNIIAGSGAIIHSVTH